VCVKQKNKVNFLNKYNYSETELTWITIRRNMSSICVKLFIKLREIDKSVVNLANVTVLKQKL